MSKQKIGHLEYEEELRKLKEDNEILQWESGRVHHLLEYARELEEQIDDHGHFIINGSQEDRVWREEHEINEISLDGEWSGGEGDSEWIGSKPTGDEKDFEEEAA